MRGKVKKALLKALDEQFAKVAPALERIDAGTQAELAWRCEGKEGRWLFVGITCHDQDDNFRTHIAWSSAPDYPMSAQDLSLTLDQMWPQEHGETNLADFVPQVPCVLWLDPATAGWHEAWNRCVQTGEPLPMLPPKAPVDEALRLVPEAVQTVTDAITRQVLTKTR